MAEMADMGDTSDNDSQNHEEKEEVEVSEERYVHRFVPRGNFPSTMSNFPTQAELKRVVRDDRYEPSGWWESKEVSASARPWAAKLELKRQGSIAPEQMERWTRTKKTVSYALKSTLGYGLDAAHDILEIGADVAQFLPIPALQEAGRVLLTIWDALQLVHTNRMACLRLTERCADILISVHTEVHEAGDQVSEELRAPLAKLIESFKGVHVLLQKQVHRPFLKRYLKRDDILRSINGCDGALNDALSLFSLSIQIRTLRQIQAAEAQRIADTERLIASLTPIPSRSETTPKQHTKPLPSPPTIIVLPKSSPPEYITTSLPSSSPSNNTDTTSSPPSSQSQSGGSPTPHSKTSTSKTEISHHSSIPSELLQSPFPTPSNEGLPLPSASEDTLHPPPPSPEAISAQLFAIVEKQERRDREFDVADLRALMREALSMSTDAEMIRVLEVRREDVPEALKTLQRALEREREREAEEAERSISSIANEGEECDDREKEDETDAIGTAKMAKTMTAGAQSRNALRLGGLRRRLTMDSAVTRASKKSKVSKTGSRWSTQTQAGDRDTLDREFIETGIDALRRLSKGQDLNLPNWTITRYEVDMEAKVGYGFFSDVYRARWHDRAVAVKVLTQRTSQRTFIHEMKLWQSLDHPNVLPLLGASSAVGEPPWFLVSPFMKNGNLVDYLRARSGSGNSENSALTRVDAAMERRMVYEIARGMAYLHRQGVMHGDLKGTNVLLDDNEHCVISDFGQSEMKNEAFRLSGTQPNRGTLRWQAPEIMTGATAGHLTYQVDVYAFAIVCVEIYSHGQLPWGIVDDDAYRRLILDENKRPPIVSTTCPNGLLNLIETCWVKDSSVRPTFQKIVRELKRLGLSKYANSPPLGGRSWLIDEGSQRKHSPDLKPTGLPSFENSEPSSSKSSPGPNGRSHMLLPSGIPMQRIITPISEESKPEETGKQASPVDYKPIKFPPVVGGARSETTPEQPLKDREDRIRSQSESAKPDHQSQSTSSSRTDSSDVYEHPYLNGPGFEELTRFESPPPADEIIAQRKNEARYRLTLQHSFHPSLRLAIWDPSSVDLGAVGYISRPSGRFVTLFNAFNPPETSAGLADGMSNVFGYGQLERGIQRQDSRNMAQRSKDLINGLLWFRSRATGDYQRNVSRRVSFPIKARQKSAFIYVEQTQYHYMDNLDTPKRWFEANIDRILQLYAEEHRLAKEDVYLIIGKLDTPDYGLFVNHNNPDGMVHFNVFTSPKRGQKWGAFSIDLESLPMPQAAGPNYHEDVPGKHAAANKVSEVGRFIYASGSSVNGDGGSGNVTSSGRWDSVLLARLRFRPDETHPTAS